MVKDQEVNWLDYFKSIQTVCPWSLQSYTAGRLLILPYNPRTIAENDITWNDDICDAVMYTDAPKDIDRLDAEVEDLNQIEESDCIYFWSHPEHTKGGGFQTPIPVIIQQSKNNLEQIRKQYK